MSDDMTKDLETSLKLTIAKRMKEALLSGETEEAKKWAAKLQEAEDLVAKISSQKSPNADASHKKVRPPIKKEDASGKWIN